MLIKNKLIIISLIIIMSSISIYAGHFLFSSKEAPKLEEKMVEEKKTLMDASSTSAVKCNSRSIILNGNKQEVRVLEVDLAKNSVEIKPVLAHDSIFGFEKLSSIARRSNAYAAINGGFFFEYGQPGGMVAIDGKLITKATGEFPVFFIKGGEARLQDMNMSLSLRINDREMKIDSINTLPKAGQAVLYTSVYGEDTRIKTRNISIIIKDGIVCDIAEREGKCSIPGDGMVVSLIHPNKYSIPSLPLKKGDKVELKTQPEFTGTYQAYECGSWILKDGNIVIGNKDGWVGLLTNPDPRTAVAVKPDGKVLLVTVDGRQPGYSVGVTGKELGEILLQLGAKDAAMLDGGSSTEMIVKGEIVNKPSNRKEERLLGGALVVGMK